jgi:hypothetical protein
MFGSPARTRTGDVVIDSLNGRRGLASWEHATAA